MFYLRQQMHLRAEMSALMNETLNVSGVLLIKIFGRGNDEVRRFADTAGRSLWNATTTIWDLGGL